MTERLQPQGSGHRTVRRRTPGGRVGRVRDAGTMPVPPPPSVATPGEPTILGFPAEFADVDDGGEAPVGGAGPGVPASSSGLTVLRRADPVGAGALVLAGAAANVSLLVSWSAGEGAPGLALVRRGVEALRVGWGGVEGGYWQPPVVVLSGGLLVLLGLLLLIRARSPRLVGVLALAVSLTAATALVLLVTVPGMTADRFGPGLWCAVAVPVLGLLGSLKAMLTVPLVTLRTGSAASTGDVAGIGA